ncbi:MAG: cell division protein FtsL [Candidatus Aminicenantes bacterium]|nr:cell division protein FtsL [Candidatus Aminicenantes bacterium]
MKKQAPVRRRTAAVSIFVVFMLFILLFTYSSLNLKSIDYGYKMQALNQQVETLEIEIDKLRAERAFLVSLERVDRLARSRLGLAPPTPDQVIRAVRRSREN